MTHSFPPRSSSELPLFIDAGNFKAVNEKFGQVAGDAVLVALSACIKETLRKDDFAARIGGDEFVVIIDPFDADAVAEELASRIRTCVSQPITLPDGQTYHGSVRVRIADLPHSRITSPATRHPTAPARNPDERQAPPQGN